MFNAAEHSWTNVKFWAQSEDPSNDPRAYVLAEVGAVIRKKREGETKRKIATQRELVMAQQGVQIMGRDRLCLSLHLVSLWRKSGWRNGAFKKIRCLFIITAFLALFGDVELPN